MDVYRQTFSGIQQLDEKFGVGSEQPVVGRTEPPPRSVSHRLGQRDPTAEDGHARRVLTADARRRADPVLRHAVAGRSAPATEIGDAAVPAVEAVGELVRVQPEWGRLFPSA
jgi:hypothetical protein